MWSLRSILFHALVCISLVNLSHCRLDLNPTAREATKLHNLFKRYNKPAVKEIKTIHGDTYNCVDFYKQPAFDHPLLKNHTYSPQMEFSTLHGEAASNVSQENPFEGLWVNGEGCPTGTVPMRKYTRDEFIRTHKLLQALYPADDPIPGTFRTSVHTKNEPQKLYGASAYVNIFNYPVDKDQYTGSYTLVRAGNDQLQYGWIIHPLLYGDTQTRTFVSTTIDKTRCFNLRCGQYVHTNKDVPIDSVLYPTTQRGVAKSAEIKLAIIQDPKTKIWQLYGTDILLGYWPNEVLKGLKGPAEYLEWGGEAYNPPNKGLLGPGMGSAFFPVGQPLYDGYARQICKYDENGSKLDVATGETESYADNSEYYKIQDRGYFNEDYGHIALFGGPGKQT